MKIERYLENALIKLLKTKKIDNIHVTEIIDEIGICKGTFYKYYCDKYDLLRHSFHNFYYKDVIENSATYEEFLHNSLEVFRQNPEVFLHAFQSDDVNTIKKYNNELIYRFIEGDSAKRNLDVEGENFRQVTKIYAGCVTDTVMVWLKDGCRQSNEKLEEILLLLLPGILSKAKG